MLQIKDLHVSINGKKILENVNLEVKRGEIVALMGPNGSGKSTLSYAIMGHPSYAIEKGKILLEGKNLTNLESDERAKLGLFLSFQHPPEVSGITLSNFLRTALNEKLNKKISFAEFKKILYESLDLLKIPREFSDRYLNEGFSGGEKKKSEILQLAVLSPKIAILDETDSGLDIDALKIVASGINKLVKKNNLGVLLITHYLRILNYIKPNKVYIMVDGKIVEKGSKKLALELEKKGYSRFLKK